MTDKPRRRAPLRVSAAVKKEAAVAVSQKKEYAGDIGKMISTGSTLLDLAISGGRVKGGGLPGGILVEVFGPSSAGKTVILCEIAGAVQRKGGRVMFQDPEARLNRQFAQMFDLDTDEIEYSNPDTVTEVFKQVRAWETPKGKAIHGIFTDSLAALSTDLEMDKEEGDKMGMRRAKEFSEQLRKTCRHLTNSGQLMVCSNQVRQNADASPYSEKYSTPGGMAIGFYASLRLRARAPEKITIKENIAGKEVKRVIGVKTEFEVYKSSVWKPYRTAPVYILFDYGVDDVRANLQFIKDYTTATAYTVGGEKIGVAMDAAIARVEERGLEKQLQQEVIELWEKIEGKFETERKPKQR